MSVTRNQLTVFTKPWPEKPLPELGKFVKDMGFDGVELPVRPGFQVTPDTITKDLPEAVKILADQGVRISSVAGDTDEATISAMGEAGVQILRACVAIDMKIGYMATEKKVRKEYDALVPILDKHGVTIGVQNHCDNFVGSAIGIMHLIEKYDPKHVGAVLDMAHCAVDGEPEAMALDIVWSHLCLMNFKSAFHRRVNGLESREARWEIQWSTARHSGYSWQEVVNLLKQRGYEGDMCLTAEYSNPDGNGHLTGDDVIPLLAYDLEYIKSLIAEDAQSS